MSLHFLFVFFLRNDITCETPLSLLQTEYMHLDTLKAYSYMILDLKLSHIYFFSYRNDSTVVMYAVFI